MGHDSSAGIGTLLAGQFGDWIPVGARFSAPVQIDPGAHPAFCIMGTGSFPGLKWPERGVDHPLLYSAEVKERVELYLYSPSGPSWPVIEWTLPLPYIYIYIIYNMYVGVCVCVCVCIYIYIYVYYMYVCLHSKRWDIVCNCYMVMPCCGSDSQWLACQYGGLGSVPVSCHLVVSVEGFWLHNW